MKEDPITNKIQRFQHPTMEVGFFLNNNNGSDTDMTVEPLFLTTPQHSFMVVGKVTITVNINMNTVNEINTALHRQS